ncbi:MAG: phosphate signaling complex protein PhoU [Spirochaetaceae bacterium]
MERRRQLDERLSELYQEILRMGALVEEALRKAVLALKTDDQQLADTVRSEDAQIDAMQIAIEDLCMHIIALEQPVATDLRELITATKLASELERIGDHARHIARRVNRLPKELLAIAVPGIDDMANVGVSMLHDSLSAYVAQDEAQAREVAEKDDEIDAAHRKLYQSLIAIMRDRPEWIEHGVELMFLNRYMERLGDHVTNMCEWVIFARSGEHVELNK